MFDSELEYLAFIRLPENSHLVGNRTYSRISPNGYECSTKGDTRFSPFITRLRDGRTIENAYQLDVKGFRIIGDNWRDAKGHAPLVVKPYSGEKWTRAEVEKDTDWLYIFTDNTARTSGSNRGDELSLYGITFVSPYGFCYPWKTQAVIRGLDNSCPITTMVNQSGKQWTDDRKVEYASILQKELEYIKLRLKNGNFKGIIFAPREFGNGEISNMKDSAPHCFAMLGWVLSKIGITNGTPPVSIYPENRDMYGEYLKLYQQWAMENPHLILTLAMKSHGKVLTDMFGYGEVTQARALCQILNDLKL